MALISLLNCIFGYNDNNLLDGVSIVFNNNEHVAIIGDNGSCKTTLLRLLMGDLLPDSGTVNKNASVYMLNQINVSESKSGGEQQMFALMRAFESSADILLLDEPTNNECISKWSDSCFARQGTFATNGQDYRITKRAIKSIWR